MKRETLIFFLVIAVTALIGGFVGGEWSGYGRVFSPTGALVGAVVPACVLLGLGALFDRQERNDRKKSLPDDVREIFDRMHGRDTLTQHEQQKVKEQTAAESSLQRKMKAIDPLKVHIFVETMMRFGSMEDPIRTAEFARIKLLAQHDPVIAAVKSQKEFLDSLLNSSRGDPEIMGSHIANSCFGLCELVVLEKVSEAVGREYFISFIKVFERVHGIKVPFQGGPFDFETSLELAREALKKGDRRA